jgi:AraC-like DNA-binding protein
MKSTSTTFKAFSPCSLLADVVEVIWDWDVPDADVAKALVINAPPATSVFLVAQYRAPLRSNWSFGFRHHSVSPYDLYAIQGQTGVVIAQPEGPLGLTKVCLKAESASRVLGVPIQEFADTRIELRNIFSPSELALLQEGLITAPNSRLRASAFEAFLLRQMRSRHAVQDTVARHAALFLQRDPSLTVRQLASVLDLSERGLERRFKALFGTSPKRFARLARFEMAVAARLSGRAWSDVAYRCGFTDQAHLVREFNLVAGQSPEALFRNLSACSGGLMQFYRPPSVLAPPLV